MPASVFVDKLLKTVDEVLRTSRLPLTTYLLLVAAATSVATLLLRYLPLKSSRKSGSGTSALRRVALGVITVNMLLSLAGIISSFCAFHYSLALVFSLLMVPATLYLATTAGGGSPGIKKYLLALAVISVFVFGSRHLVTGVEEHETTSDMINIRMNGHFRWSIHGSHYDLAPLDPILKVIYTYVAGSGVYDPVAASAIYFSFGLTAFMLMYALAVKFDASAAAVALLCMISYPYSPMVGLSVPPAPLSQLLAVSLITILLRPTLGRGIFGAGDYIVVALFAISATLIHPSSLSLVAFLVTLTALLYWRASSERRYATYALLLASMVYATKVLYTAFATSFVGYLQSLWEYILSAIHGTEVAAFTTRNLGYSGLPRVCLTGFGVLPGFVGGLALPVLLKTLRRETPSITERLFLGAAVLYGAFALASLLTGVGGVSQSRILMNGAQHFIELALALYLAANSRAMRRATLIPLVLASLATLITPNALPLNYTIPMSRPATLNDHAIAYSFMELVDKSYYAQLYSSCGDAGRIVAMQERGETFYGLGSTQAVTYCFIAPRAIPAKSYWDPCVMAIHSVPKNPENYITERIFDAWIYGFYLYLSY